MTAGAFWSVTRHWIRPVAMFAALLELNQKLTMCMTARRLLQLHRRSSCLPIPIERGRSCSYSCSSWLNRMVLSSLRHKPIRYDTSRRGVSPSMLAISITQGDWAGLLAFGLGPTNFCSLHPTQYPWEHTQYLKTFDHQA